MFRKTVYLPIKLINKASDEGWLRSLAYLVRLKSVYENNTFFNFSLRSVAQKVHCSPWCLKTHLEVLEQHGLIRYHCGNLTIVGYKKLCVLVDGQHSTGVTVDFKHQFDILRSLLLKFNLQRQAYRMRRRGSNLRNISSAIGFENYVGLSCKGIGRLYGLSKESGSRIRRKLEKLRIIKSEKVFLSLAEGINYQQYLILKYDARIPAWSFFQKGNIMIQTRNKIEYISPIESKKALRERKIL